MLERWLANEPVRTYIWGLVTPLLALAVTYGIVTEDGAVSIGALAAAVLLIPAGVAVRGKVRPDRPVE